MGGHHHQHAPDQTNITYECELEISDIKYWLNNSNEEDYKSGRFKESVRRFLMNQLCIARLIDWITNQAVQVT